MYLAVAAHKISEVMSKISAKGGFSLTTGFNIEFTFPKKSDTNPFSFAEGFYTDSGKSLVNLLCDEAQLPNVQSGVSQLSGRFLGEGPIYYPHTRIYTDLSLGFLLDGDLTPLKFFTGWYESIFSDDVKTYTGNIDQVAALTPNATNRVNRLKFSDEYTCDLKITKTEPNASGADGRAPATYIMENCYPYSIDSVPLSYGSSQVSRLTVNFYYTRHTVLYGSYTGT